MNTVSELIKELTEKEFLTREEIKEILKKRFNTNVNSETFEMDNIVEGIIKNWVQEDKQNRTAIVILSQPSEGNEVALCGGVFGKKCNVELSFLKAITNHKALQEIALNTTKLVEAYKIFSCINGEEVSNE